MKTAQLQRDIDNRHLPSEIIDRARYGGNSLPIKDDSKPNYSPFYVFVSGNIESGQINEFDGICCKYDFMAGTDWSIVDVSIPFLNKPAIGKFKWSVSTQLQESTN